MTHAHKPRGERIDVLDDASRARWAATLGVTEAALKAAVRRYGTKPATVRAALGLPPA